MKIIQYIKRKLGISYPTPEELRKAGAVIGEDVYIFTKRIDLAHAFLLEIGSHVTLSDCRILLHDGSTKRPLNYSRVGRVKIGDNCFIGAEAIILPNTEIGDNCIVGAGAVVTKDIKAGSVVAGNPAKVICSYEEFVKRNADLLRHAPVFNTYHANKTMDEKMHERTVLKDGGIGFDV